MSKAKAGISPTLRLARQLSREAGIGNNTMCAAFEHTATDLIILSKPSQRPWTTIPH